MFRILVDNAIPFEQGDTGERVFHQVAEPLFTLTQNRSVLLALGEVLGIGNRAGNLVADTFSQAEVAIATPEPL